MTSIVYDLAAAVRSQAVRLRGSGVMLPIAGLPVAAVGLATIALALSKPVAPALATEMGPWKEAIESTFGLWALFLLPLLTALVAAQVASVEHNARGWKHLFALPPWRGAHVVSAWVAVAGLTAAATATLAIGVALAGTVVSALRPELGMPAAPVAALMGAAGLVYVCTLPLVSGHLWLSVRWPGIGVGLGVAIVGVLSSVVLLNLGAGAVTPYGLATSALMTSRPWLGMVGVTVGVVVLLASAWHTARRDAPG